MKLVDYSAGGQPEKEFWDKIDEMLAEQREKALTIPLEERAAFTSLYVYI
jgi:hypothetical protein